MRLPTMTMRSILLWTALGAATAVAQSEATAPAVAPDDTAPAEVEHGAPGEVGGDKPSPDFPNEGPLFDEYRDVAKDLRCPTCTGLSVLESEAKFSEQIKDIVKEQVKSGKSKDEILKYFTERYGPWILRAPPREGFNTIAWLVPIVLLVLGPPLVWLLVWRRRRLVSTMGVRLSEDIINEMHAQLDRLRSRGGAESKGG